MVIPLSGYVCRPMPGIRMVFVMTFLKYVLGTRFVGVPALSTSPVHAEFVTVNKHLGNVVSDDSNAPGEIGGSSHNRCDLNPTKM